VARKKQTHRQILAYWESEILNRNLGISPAGDSAFYFVDSVLRAYAVAEERRYAPVSGEKAPPRDDSGEKDSLPIRLGAAMSEARRAFDE
jgi:hypothetical protein